MTVNDLVRNLRAFDSHERGLLLQWATGSPFTLSEKMRHAIEEKIDRRLPADALVAMDYTLDWLFAATRRSLDPDGCRNPQPWPDDGALAASIQDVDLLVAWEDDEGPHLVLIEAKGFTGWSNKQMASKAHRLDAIFNGGLAETFDVHFILVGPTPSKGLKTEGWPEWMRPERRTHFLPMPDPGPRLAVQRCDLDGTGMQAGFTHWQSVARSWTSTST